MKKTYHKPQILFEDITFNTAISGCTAQTVVGCMPTPGVGGWSTPTEVEGNDLIMFVKGVYGCVDTSGCYHVPGSFDQAQLNMLS